MATFMVIARFEDGTDQARATVETRPMAKWWGIDVFPIAAAPTGGAA